MAAPLRLLVYDRTCPALSKVWRAGAVLYRGLRRIDAARGVASWDEAFAWLAGVEPSRNVAEVQYWGHGKWGLARVGQQALDVAALAQGHALHAPLAAVRARLLPGAQGLWWFRTCETFGAAPGQRFAVALAGFLRCRVAGHTHVIAAYQSGLHSLLPGEAPRWSPEEGIAEGTPSEPAKAFDSGPRQPNTITFLHGRIPPLY